MPAKAFPRSYPSALMPSPIVSHAAQSTCSFGSGVLSPGNSQSICHAVIDAFSIVPGHAGIGYRLWETQSRSGPRHLYAARAYK